MIVCKGHIWDTFSLVDDNFVVVLPGGGVLHLHHGVTCQHGGEVQPSETDGGNTCVWWGVWRVATRDEMAMLIVNPITLLPEVT